MLYQLGVREGETKCIKEEKRIPLELLSTLNNSDYGVVGGGMGENEGIEERKKRNTLHIPYFGFN